MTGTLRPAFIGGVALMLLGGLLLLRQLGILPGPIPVGSLVVIGLGGLLIFSGRQGAMATRAVPHVPTAVVLDGASAARLVLNHGAGVLTVSAGAAPGRLVEGFVTGGVQQKVMRVGDRLEVELRPDAEWQRWPAEYRTLSWNLALGDGAAVDLVVNTGASQVRLDLADLHLPSLKVQTGASDVDITVPAHGECRTSVSAGAANIRIRVPEGVAAAVRNRSALASFTIDQARFPAVGDRFESPGYADATDRADIEIDGGVASFSVD